MLMHILFSPFLVNRRNELLPQIRSIIKVMIAKTVHVFKVEVSIGGKVDRLKLAPLDLLDFPKWSLVDLFDKAHYHLLLRCRGSQSAGSPSLLKGGRLPPQGGCQSA